MLEFAIRHILNYWKSYRKLVVFGSKDRENEKTWSNAKEMARQKERKTMRKVGLDSRGTYLSESI